MKHFALVLFLLATSASAQELMRWTSTGNDLIALCKRETPNLGTPGRSWTRQIVQASSWE